MAVMRVEKTDFNPRTPCGARPPRPCPLCPAGPYFNPRAPCGARHARARRPGATAPISIHAPLAGRDGRRPKAGGSCCYFNPRAPCGARQAAIHPTAAIITNFNPRAPCGARPKRQREVADKLQFQSTRPLRGATALTNAIGEGAEISIHAPLAGRDPPCRMQPAGGIVYFNPRAPCGARQQ